MRCSSRSNDGDANAKYLPIWTPAPKKPKAVNFAARVRQDFKKAASLDHGGNAAGEEGLEVINDFSWFEEPVNSGLFMTER